MYKIHTFENHLLVKFEDDFDYNAIRAVIHHETLLAEYERMDDIWLIGKYHALISLGDLESMVSEFRCRCPKSATREKTAIVVDPGLAAGMCGRGVQETEVSWFFCG